MRKADCFASLAMTKTENLETMNKYRYYITTFIIALTAFAGCKVPALQERTANTSTPQAYAGSSDTTNTAAIRWRDFFIDKGLTDLIDTALRNNQEIKITLQEIEIARNDIRMREGALHPTVGTRLGVGVEKVGEFTSQGAGDKSTEITDGRTVPVSLTDITAALTANWEVDIWHKLHNAQKAAVVPSPQRQQPASNPTRSQQAVALHIAGFPDATETSQCRKAESCLPSSMGNAHDNTQCYTLSYYFGRMLHPLLHAWCV